MYPKPNTISQIPNLVRGGGVRQRECWSAAERKFGLPMLGSYDVLPTGLELSPKVLAESPLLLLAASSSWMQLL
jgi:hypothetical protein